MKLCQKICLTVRKLYKLKVNGLGNKIVSDWGQGKHTWLLTFFFLHVYYWLVLLLPGIHMKERTVRLATSTRLGLPVAGYSLAILFQFHVPQVAKQVVTFSLLPVWAHSFTAKCRWFMSKNALITLKNEMHKYTIYLTLKKERATRNEIYILNI